MRLGCEVRTELDGELSLVVSSFWSLLSWLFSAVKSNAVGGGAADTAAATGGGGRVGGSKVERGRSVMLRSSWSRYFFALRYVCVGRLECWARYRSSRCFCVKSDCREE